MIHDLLIIFSEIGRWLWIVLMTFTVSIVVHWFLAGRPTTIDGHAQMLVQSKDMIRLWRAFMIYAVPVILCYVILTL